MSVAEELEKLAGLLERGHITREEYDAQKVVLFGGASSASSSAAAVNPTNSEAFLSGGTRLATPTDPGPSKPSLPASAGGDALGVGTTLADRYIITRKLGEGGMGAVYLAVDRDTEQNVAVKTIAARLTNQPGMLDSLKKEVAMARKLGAHSNLLRILDIHLRHSPPFITMEAAMGGDLHEYWLSQSRKLRPDDLTRILKQVLSGLEALHKARVVHQDIKPQNILLTAEGSVKITDYGISKSIKEQVNSGGVDGAGTLAFMAPEQLKGEICDRRADIYAVGIMAHQLLTGKFPFSASTEAEVEAWHKTGARDIQRLPGSYSALISQMIAIRPDDRFSSAQEVLDALESIENRPKAVAAAPAPAPTPAPAPAPAAVPLGMVESSQGFPPTSAKPAMIMACLAFVCGGPFLAVPAYIMAGTAKQIATAHPGHPDTSSAQAARVISGVYLIFMSVVFFLSFLLFVLVVVAEA